MVLTRSYWHPRRVTVTIVAVGLPEAGGVLGESLYSYTTASRFTGG